MLKEVSFALIAMFFLSLNTITGVQALDEKKAQEREKPILLLEEKRDVTGDGKVDTVKLTGIPYEEGALYLKNIFLKIKASNGKTYKTELEGGYEPSIKFVDLNHDGLEDMFISIPTGGSGGISNYFLYTLKDFQLTEIPIPESLNITSQFLDGYKGSITIEDTGQSYTFDLIDRKKEYDRLGLYQNGKLNEPREMMVDPYSTLKPIVVKDDLYGLKGIQQISGAYHADGIAFVESTWYFENGQWNLVDAKVMERKKEERKNNKKYASN